MIQRLVKSTLLVIALLHLTAYAAPNLNSIDPSRMPYNTTVRNYLITVLREFGSTQNDLANIPLQDLAKRVKRKSASLMHPDLQSDTHAKSIYTEINKLLSLVETGIQRGLLFKDLSSVDYAISNVTLSRFLNFSIFSVSNSHLTNSDDDISMLLLGRRIIDANRYGSQTSSQSRSTSQSGGQTQQQHTNSQNRSNTNGTGRQRSVFDELNKMFGGQNSGGTGQETQKTARESYNRGIETAAPEEVKGYNVYPLKEQLSGILIHVYATQNLSTDELNVIFNNAEFKAQLNKMIETKKTSLLMFTPIILKIAKKTPLLGPTKIEYEQLMYRPSACGSLFDGMF